MPSLAGSPTPGRVAVLVEVAPRRAFASALDWPGWARPGRDEGAALAALAGCADRYAAVAAAGHPLPVAAELEVVERAPGTATTAFGAPDVRARLDARPTDAAEGARLAAQRTAIRGLLAAPSDGSPLAGRKWPPRYAARRIAWHVLDHAWEIEDRTER